MIFECVHFFFNLFFFFIVPVHIDDSVIQEVMTLGDTKAYHMVIILDCKKKYTVKVTYHQEKQGILLQVRLYSSNIKQAKKN